METHVCGYGIRVLHPIRHDGWSWHEVAASMKREPVRKQKYESPWEKTGKCQMGDFCPLKKSNLPLTTASFYITTVFREQEGTIPLCRE